jgi:hypothetical protein
LRSPPRPEPSGRFGVAHPLAARSEPGSGNGREETGETPAGEKSEERARRLRRFSVGCGVLTALGFVVLIASQVFHRGGEHGHPVAPHGGRVVSLERGDAHYHAELVVEPSGVVRLYLLGPDPTVALPIESQLIIAKIKPDDSGEVHDVVIRTDPAATTVDGQTTALIGRLPGEAVAQRFVFRVQGLRVRGESFDFDITWEAGEGTEMAVAYEADQRRIYLSAGGKYTEADIAASGRTTAAARYRGHRAGHGTQLRSGTGCARSPV